MTNAHRFICFNTDPASTGAILSSGATEDEAYAKAEEYTGLNRLDAIAVQETTPRLAAFLEFDAPSSWRTTDDGKADFDYLRYAVFKKTIQGVYVDLLGHQDHTDAHAATVEICDDADVRIESSYLVVSMPFEVEFDFIFERHGIGWRKIAGREAMTHDARILVRASDFEVAA